MENRTMYRYLIRMLIKEQESTGMAGINESKGEYKFVGIRK